MFRENYNMKSENNVTVMESEVYEIVYKSAMCLEKHH